MKRILYFALGAGTVAFAPAATADILFDFQEVGPDIVMTSSGTFDTSGLPITSTNAWGGTGIEENGKTDIMGGTSFGGVDLSLSFNEGTDFSGWQSGNPWNASDFSWIVNAGSHSFTTYTRDGAGNRVPGLGIVRSDLDGALWTPDQTWTRENATFASLGMNEGLYTVTDAVTGESISYLIGVPAPGAMALLGVAGLVSRRRRRA